MSELPDEKALARWAEVAKLIVGPPMAFVQNYADAHKIKVTARAKIAAKELTRRAEMSAQVEAIRHQENVEAITARAKQVLEDGKLKKALPEQRSKESDPDWFFKWKSYAQESSDNEIRNLWAKVLAGEIAQPGRFSLRLLQAIHLLRKSDAENFARFANYVWRDTRDVRFLLTNPVTTEFLEGQRGMDSGFLGSLHENGLITYPSLKDGLHSLQGEHLHFLGYAGRAFQMPHLDYWGLYKILTLTNVGRELMALCDPVPDLDYLDNVSFQLEAVSSIDPWPWPDMPPVAKDLR